MFLLCKYILYMVGLVVVNKLKDSKRNIRYIFKVFNIRHVQWKYYDFSLYDENCEMKCTILFEKSVKLHYIYIYKTEDTSN